MTATTSVNTSSACSNASTSTTGRPVNVSVNMQNENGTEKTILLGALPNPLKFEDLAQCLADRGYTCPPALVSVKRTEYHVEVSDAPSTFTPGRGGQINMDLPLILFYHKCFLPILVDRSSIASDTGSVRPDLPSISEAEFVGKKQVRVGGVGFTFQRTVRVPDNRRLHALPPGLGSFDLYNVVDAPHRLPRSVIHKGGIFFSMWQREAMWLQFYPSDTPCAVKISIGGINALTGLPQTSPSTGTQDYLSVSQLGSGQRWLDGISVAPGVIRQFVAAPLGHGHTVEGQLTGKEETGGLQIDVYPKFPTTVEFSNGDEQLDMYKTPRQLGLDNGSSFEMVDLNDGYGRIVLGNSKSVQNSILLSTPSIELEASDEPYVLYIRLSEGCNDFIMSCDYSETVSSIKYKIAEEEGVNPEEYILSHAGVELEDREPISKYNIIAGSEVFFTPKTGTIRYRSAGASLMIGFAAGGQIIQKINKDPLPPTAYDYTRGTRLHVSVLNAAYFSALTGLPTPPSPISPQTYNKCGMPWFALYDEAISCADNNSIPTPLTSIKSLAGLDLARKQAPCVGCMQNMAEELLHPCGHVACGECLSAMVPVCPSCQIQVIRRERFAAPMHMPGREEGETSARTVALTPYMKTGRIASFVYEEHAVHELCGQR